ncbi:Hypothetical_protein [Hexamita inflata]|uniref:Hypothetical_protein n=1 Tax=Hexamita inflata TaxID=28002 RepID=A0AA86V4Q3_9EUKA|nr:Hypothetical protein HINF_LOCUS64066 [Hexamita inflata]
MQLSSSNVYDLYASSASVNTESRTARPAINDLLHFSKYAFDSQTSFVDLQKPQASLQNEHILNEKITQLSEDDIDSVHTDQIQRLEQLRLRLLRQKQIQKPDRVEHMKQILNEQIKQKELQMKQQQNTQMLNNTQQVINSQLIQKQIELQNKNQIQNAIQQQNKTNKQTEESEIEVECETVQIHKRKQKKTNPQYKQTNSVEIITKENKTITEQIKQENEQIKDQINKKENIQTNKDKTIDKQELNKQEIINEQQIIKEQIKETSEKQTQMTETQTVSIQTTEQTFYIQTEDKSVSNQNASEMQQNDKNLTLKEELKKIEPQQNNDLTQIEPTINEQIVTEKLQTVNQMNQTNQESIIIPTNTQEQNTFTNTQQTLTQIPTNGSLSYQNMVTARQISQELNELFQKIQSPSKQSRVQNEKDEIMFLLSEIHPFQKNTQEKDSEETDLLSPFEQTQRQQNYVVNYQDESSNQQQADQPLNIQNVNDDEISKSVEESNLKKSEQTNSQKLKDVQNAFGEEIHEQISTNTPNLCNQQPIMTLNTILSESEHSKGNQKLQLQDFEVTQTYKLTKSQKLLSKPNNSNQFNELLVKKVSKQSVNTIAQQNVSIKTQQIVESISQTSISQGRYKDIQNSNVQVQIINPQQLQSLISPIKSDNNNQYQTNYQIINATQLIDSNSDQMIPKKAQSQSNQQDEKYTSEECDQFQQFKNQMLANIMSHPLTLSNILLQSPAQNIDKSSQSIDSPQSQSFNPQSFQTVNTQQSGLNYKIGCKIERSPQQHCIPVQLPNQMRFSLDEPVNYPKVLESSQLNIKVKNDVKTVPVKENSLENEIVDATLSFQNGVDSDSLIPSKPEDSDAHIHQMQEDKIETFQSQSEQPTNFSKDKSKVEISKNADQVKPQIVITEQPKALEQQPEKQTEDVQNTENNISQINESPQITKQIKQEPIQSELKETPDQIQVISLQSKQCKTQSSQQTKSTQIQIAPKKRIKSEMIQNEPSFDEVEVFNVKKQTTCIQNEKQIQTVPKNSFKTIENSTSDLVFKNVESVKMQQLESISETTENIGLLQQEPQDQSKQNKVEQNVHYSLEYQPIKETKVQTPLKLKEIAPQNVQNIKINENSLFDSESLSFKENVDFSEETVSWHDSPALKVAVQNQQKEQQKPPVFIPQYSNQQVNSQIKVTRTQQSNQPIQQPTRIKITKSNNEYIHMYNVQQVAKSNLKYSELSEQTEQLIEQTHQNVVPINLNQDQSLVNTKSSLIRDFDSVLEAECSAEVQYILQ